MKLGDCASNVGTLEEVVARRWSIYNKSLRWSAQIHRMPMSSSTIDVKLLLCRAGLLNQPITKSALEAVSAFYRRQWSGKCTFDDIILLGASEGVDTRILIAMAEAAGELDVLG